MPFKNKNRILQQLEKHNVCYVLITCSEDAGQMTAEMNYLGDNCLASYLLHKAQLYIDESPDEPEINDGSKILSLQTKVE
jgi:hypothetical protein